VTDSEEDREPPRLQDTTERSALPLPLPGSEEPAAAEAGREAPAPADKSPAVEQSPADKSPAVESPADESPAGDPPADGSPSAGEPAGSSNGSASFDESPFPPPFGPEPSEGPRPEVLIGAAFAGGLLLALIFRRLGR
jgi:hypothetical protein